MRWSSTSLYEASCSSFLWTPTAASLSEILHFVHLQASLKLPQKISEISSCTVRCLWDVYLNVARHCTASRSASRFFFPPRRRVGRLLRLAKWLGDRAELVGIRHRAEPGWRYRRLKSLVSIVWPAQLSWGYDMTWSIVGQTDLTLLQSADTIGKQISVDDHNMGTLMFVMTADTTLPMLIYVETHVCMNFAQLSSNSCKQASTSHALKWCVLFFDILCQRVPSKHGSTHAKVSFEFLHWLFHPSKFLGPRVLLSWAPRPWVSGCVLGFTQWERDGEGIVFDVFDSFGDPIEFISHDHKL